MVAKGSSLTVNFHNIDESLGMLCVPILKASLFDKRLKMDSRQGNARQSKANFNVSVINRDILLPFPYRIKHLLVKCRRPVSALLFV
jgi:hypothetical protein